MLGGWRGIGGRDNLRVATGRREPHLARAVLVLGLLVVLGLSVAAAAGVATSSFGASGIEGCPRSISCTTFSTSVMSL